ncbi:hypothetical protein [Marinibacterium sp. SX1]|uniref:hypothetical protein n=1 Tax=Marinibacterium sp. SX1 TaxID=3388424 RepID=UPI003D184CD9
MAAAALSLLSATTPARAAPQIRLVCPGGPEAFFCQPLAAALRARYGAVIVSDSPGNGVFSVHFVTEARAHGTQSEPQSGIKSGPQSGPLVGHLSGHLAWRRADGVAGTGPTLTLSVSDAGLNDAILGRFADDLLRFTKLPL